MENLHIAKDSLKGCKSTINDAKKIGINIS